MKNNLTKREVVTRLFDTTDYPQKQIADTVQRTLDIIQDALAEGRNVEFRNFGVFEVYVRKARIGRNPNKPAETVSIPSRAVVKFKLGKTLDEKLKNLKPAST